MCAECISRKLTGWSRLGVTDSEGDTGKRKHDGSMCFKKMLIKMLITDASPSMGHSGSHASILSYLLFHSLSLGGCLT